MDIAYNRFKEFSLIDDILDSKKIYCDKNHVYTENILHQIKIISSNKVTKNCFFVNLLNYKKSIERLTKTKKNFIYIFKDESKQVIKYFEKIDDKAEKCPIKNNKQHNCRQKIDMKKTDYLTEIKKIFTFEIDNETNIIQDFLDPDPKRLLDSEYLTIDKFITMEIKSENYKEIFDEEKDDNKIYEQFLI